MSSFPKNKGMEFDKASTDDDRGSDFEKNRNNQKIQDLTLDSNQSGSFKLKGKGDRDFEESSGAFSSKKTAGEDKTVKDYDINVILTDQEKPNLILYKYRWIVLFSFFLTSSATGALQGSLSTNRNIIDKF